MSNSLTLTESEMKLIENAWALYCAVGLDAPKIVLALTAASARLDFDCEPGSEKHIAMEHISEMLGDHISSNLKKLGGTDGLEAALLRLIKRDDTDLPTVIGVAKDGTPILGEKA